MRQSRFGFGIVGTGMIAAFHAKAIAAMADAELVAVHARRIESAQSFAARHRCAPYGDYGAFLAHEGLDLVTICTPSGAHLEPAIAAASAGKHVICEKPLEVTTERIDAMIDACAEAGVMLAGVFPRRFNQATALLKQAIDGGRFGTITMADAAIKYWRTQEYYDGDGWRGTWALDGGGAMMNQASHTVDLLLHLMGDVASVRAQTRLAAHDNIEVEDVAVALLTFESGALGVLQGSTACWSEAGHPAEIQICGTHGSVFLTDDRFRVWEFRGETPDDDRIRAEYGVKTGGAGAADPSAIDFTWHQRNFKDAVDALRHNRAPRVDGVEARRAVALIRAIYDSAAAGGEKTDVEQP